MSVRVLDDVAPCAFAVERGDVAGLDIGEAIKHARPEPRGPNRLVSLACTTGARARGSAFCALTPLLQPLLPLLPLQRACAHLGHSPLRELRRARDPGDLVARCELALDHREHELARVELRRVRREEHGLDIERRERGRDRVMYVTF